VSIPELHSPAAPEARPASARAVHVRLPGAGSVSVTRRFLEVIDHPHFQRLRRVRQLGPTYLVYPGAVHTRFEHSVGVYAASARYLASLTAQPSVAGSLGERDLLTMLAAALLHDVGHYPFAHSLEALHHRGRDTPRHEDLAAAVIAGEAPGLSRRGPSIARILAHTVGVDPDRVVALIRAPRAALEPTDRLLQSVLSSAIDADKMDYLWRDSVHLGVEYGRNYDRERLLASLTVNEAGDGVAVTSKGRVSAEIFLFCRYTMFSEVYWHHTVRAASAMLEGAWADLVQRGGADRDELTSQLLTVGDDALLETLGAEAAPGSRAAHLLRGLTGGRRQLYKRLVTWSRAYEDGPGGPDARGDAGSPAGVYDGLAALDEAATEALLARLRRRLSNLGRPLGKHDLILDIPPRDKDRVPTVPVFHPKAPPGRPRYRELGEESTIVRGMARDFLATVKKIRLFLAPEHAARLQDRHDAVHEAVGEVVGEFLTRRA